MWNECIHYTSFTFYKPVYIFAGQGWILLNMQNVHSLYYLLLHFFPSMCPPPKKKTIALFILDFSLFSVPQNSNASIMRLNTMFSDQQAHGRTNRCKRMNGTQDTRVTPLLFTRSVMGFLMTTESKASVLRLIRKTVLFASIVSPSLPWGIRTHTDHRVITPCRPY